MKVKTQKTGVLLASLLVMVLASTRLNADTGTCGGVTTTLPFADVMTSAFFCQIAEAYFSGLTNGTTASTYSPSANVTREQMAAFVTRTMDQSLLRGGARSHVNRFWTNQGGSNLWLTSVGSSPTLVASDGTDVWVANAGDSTVSRVRSSDGRVIGTWTGATFAFGVLAAMGKIWVTGSTAPSGSLFRIDPSQSPGAASLVSNSLPVNPQEMAFDGQRIWTAHPSGSVSMVSLPSFTVTAVTTGFSQPYGILYDGANIWVTDRGDNKLKKLDSNGAVLTSVSVGSAPQFPVFDGTNIWVPNFGANSISVVRATGGLAGTVLATLTGNGMFAPSEAAFDGQRILVTSYANNKLSLWKATDLTPIGNFQVPGNPGLVANCSDGVNFWITFQNTGALARF